jgi:DNA-damage-inducible protein D
MPNDPIPQPSQGTVFDRLRRVGPDGLELWSARELAKALGYADYRNFQVVTANAIKACKNSGYKVADHFVDVTDMVDIGSGAKRQIDDVALSRYACYLIVQNADPAKPIVAVGQTYFAIQTRKQELTQAETYQRLKTEDEKRLFLRRELADHNKQLAEAAAKAGVIDALDYAVFQNHGYKGLYGGLDAKGIHQHKRLKKSQKILDHMGSTELAANLFRATQTEDKLRRDGTREKHAANRTHYEVGKKVRQTIEEIGGTMPENLPSEENIKKVERRTRKGIGQDGGGDEK